MGICHTSMVSRADLIRLHGELGQTVLPHIVSFSGYQKKIPPKPSLPEKKTKTVSPKEFSSDPSKETVESGPTPPVAFWRPVSCKNLSNKEEDEERLSQYYIENPFKEKEIRSNRALRLPQLQPLCPWPRLWPFLRSALGDRRDGSAIDLHKVVRKIARMRPMRRLPRLTRRSWARRCLLLVDYDVRLLPFWLDMRQLCLQLVRIRGRNGLDLIYLEQGPCGPMYRDGDDGALPAFRPPEPGTPVLILSDLGLLGDTEQVKTDWLRFGRKLRQHGVAPVVLTPAPRRKWTIAAANVFRMACWDRGQRLPKIVGPFSCGSKPLMSPKSRNGTELLLSLLSPAVRVEPELLRAARLLLDADQVDAGDEAAVWHHDHVRRSYTGFSFDPQHIAIWRRAFFSNHSAEQQQQLLELLRSHHRHLSPAIDFEEQLTFAILLNQSFPQEAEKFFRRCLKTFFKSDFTQKPQLEAYLQRVVHRHKYDPNMWQNDVMCTLYVSAHQKQWSQGRLDLPKGMDPACVTCLWLEKGFPQDYILTRIGLNFVAKKKDIVKEDSLLVGSPVVKFTSSDGMLQVRLFDGNQDTEKNAYALNLNSPNSHSIPVPVDGRVRLATTHQEVLLESFFKPDWALRLGRDADGLFLKLFRDEEDGKVYWFAPGKYVANRDGRRSDSKDYSSEDKTNTIHIQNGFWWEEAEFKDHIKNGFCKPQWANNFGQDEYGLYADFQIKGVSQRMRWIMPGEFMMGSPESEPERSDDEDLHKVIITKGFWLAETACTQALWQAVMEDNPSRFKGADRPVESISWEDCQSFIDKLNVAIPGLDICLPTEAQWEYACRAGTTTPFHFGESITTDQANFNGDYPYNNGPKGEYRKQTVTVKTFSCNSWGLYEMHGNVWEWCADWYGAYPKKTIINPMGLNRGDARVLRGGSWIDGAWNVRSANRSRLDPSNRVVYDGLRLARGQTAGQGAGGAGQSSKRKDFDSTSVLSKKEKKPSAFG
ncbi:MAG: formylglycine-generating enzyme family protein, partial [Desulfobacteraceae bacterium]